MYKPLQLATVYLTRDDGKQIIIDGRIVREHGGWCDVWIANQYVVTVKRSNVEIIPEDDKGAA